MLEIGGFCGVGARRELGQSYNDSSHENSCSGTLLKSADARVADFYCSAIFQWPFMCELAWLARFSGAG